MAEGLRDACGGGGMYYIMHGWRCGSHWYGHWKTMPIAILEE